MEQIPCCALGGREETLVKPFFNDEALSGQAFSDILLGFISDYLLEAGRNEVD